MLSLCLGDVDNSYWTIATGYFPHSQIIKITCILQVCERYSAYQLCLVILNFEHFGSLKNSCEEIKVILRFNTLLSKDEIGNLRLISRLIYSKRSD